MKSHPFARLLSVLFLVSMSFCIALAQSSPPTTPSGPPKVTGRLGWEQIYGLAEAMRKLPTWTADGQPKGRSWRPLVEFAHTLQGLPIEDIESVFVAYMIQDQMGKTRHWSGLTRPMLVTRIMFELPDSFKNENEPAARIAEVGATVAAGIPFDACGDGLFVPQPSFSVPVVWTTNGPSLSACPHEMFSVGGATYQPHLEFQYFHERFKFRAGLRDWLDAHPN